MPAAVVALTITSWANSVSAQQRPLSFEREGLELRGVIHTPEKRGAKVPGVLLLHGSGPNSASHTVAGQLVLGFGFGIEVFTEIGTELSEAGFATLRYDKRTCGPFNGCADNGYPPPGPTLTIDDFVLDARAALDALAEVSIVDDDRLFVIGLSQGGTLVPRIMGSDPRVIAGVMLATPYAPPDVIAGMQRSLADSLLTLVEADSLTASAVMSSVDRFVTLLRAVREGNATEPGPGVTIEFLRSWLETADVAPQVATTLDRPLLVLSGDLDWHAPPSETQKWEAALHRPEAGVDHEIVVLPCITHALNCITEKEPRRIRPQHIGRHVAEVVLERIVAFLTRHAN